MSFVTKWWKGAILVEPKIIIYERHSDKISQGGGGVHCVWWSQTDSHQMDRSWGFELWQVSTGWHWTRHHSIYHILRYTSLCDVWSFGVLAWEIFSKGGTPYQGMTNTRARELIDSGYRMPAPDGTPDEVYQLMLRWSAHKVNIEFGPNYLVIRCWQYDPDDRPHFAEIHATVDLLYSRWDFVWLEWQEGAQFMISKQRWNLY